MTDSVPRINPRRLRKLLQRLVDIYSPSGKEEEILHFLNGYLKKHGIAFTCQAVDSRRYNLVLAPPGGDIRLGLIGHLDTVAAYDLDEYGYAEHGDMIRGLGTADMKGGCAAMVESYISLWESGHSPMPVALCLVVGEEEEGDGAEQLVEDYHFPWGIIGEPTDLQPALSHYGYIEMQICTLGQRMHASLANKGENPIETMMHLVMSIARFIEREHPDLVYNIRDLFSTQAGFVVPERCEAWLDIHSPPRTSIAEILAEIEEIFEQEQRKNEHVAVSHKIETVDAGYELPEKGNVVEALKGVFAQRRRPWDPLAFRSHSDANQLWAAGIKPILFGPGKLEQAHSPMESVSFEKVCNAAELYVELLLKLFA